MQFNNIEYISINNQNYKKYDFENYLWRIRNNPISRKFSIKSSYINNLEHKEWLKKKLDSENSIIYLSKNENRNIGVVRFERLSKQNLTEVSIILSPEYRGYKISEKILKEALNKIFIENKIDYFLAKIHEDNDSSKKIFSNLGFQEKSIDEKEKKFTVYELRIKEIYETDQAEPSNTKFKKETVGIMQPTFLPWLGYFALMEQVDYFVLLDDVQLSKQSWQVRNRIKNNAENTLWLTLPIKKHPLNTPINKIEISNDKRLINKILTSFEHNYSKCEFFSEAYDLVYKNIFNSNLSNITSEIIEDVKSCIGISTPVYKTSDIKIENNNREQRLIDIINFFNCKKYVSPIGSSKYLELEKSKRLFEKNNIEVKYLHFIHPKYRQNGTTFLEQMGIIDCIANVGYTNMLDLIKSGTKEPTKFPKL